MIETLIALALVVIGVSDGDTLTVRDGDNMVVIRLAEIDAPERTQPYSQVSRRNLETLCRHAKAVEFRPVDIDRYGRTVAHVYCDGVHVNWRQVEDGLAWCFTRYLKHPDQCLLLEKAATETKRGLWRDPSPVTPWEFRTRGATVRPPREEINGTR
jgi:endonuclease YncB( thermonuclease family)